MTTPSEPTQPSPTTDQPSSTPWGLILGGIGLVVAIIALALAMSAKNSAIDEADVTKIIVAQNAKQSADLKADIAAANEVVTRLAASQAVAKETRTKLAKTDRANQARSVENATAIKTLQDDVAKLQRQESATRKRVVTNTSDIDTLKADQEALTKKVDAANP